MSKTKQEASEKAAKANNALERIGLDLLKSYPSKNEIFMTSDGAGFFDKSNAENHAVTLTNKIVTPIKKQSNESDRV